jgi:3-oxoacyl-[acyl-carrier-protein] synthase-1
MPKALLTISAYTLTNALGHGNRKILDALRARQTGLRHCDFDIARLDTWIGRVDDVEQASLPPPLLSYDCRNNRLAQLALEQDGFSESVGRCCKKYGPDRVGLFLGTSTSGIHTTELAYRKHGPGMTPLPADYRFEHTHSIHSLTDFVSHYLGIRGPALTISTACSSSAKVFASAHRSIQAGLCDAAIVGGVDSLCLTTLYGFNALQLIASDPCRPWDSQRNGINIGEGAGFALLERVDASDGEVFLLGYGESSDAHHIASPHPQGLGAALAMQGALDMAGVEAGSIDYINLHGTATRANDSSENAALHQVFGDEIPPFSSTKGWTGHTLGAAGITEAVICCLGIEQGFQPGTLNTGRADPELSANLILENRNAPVRHAISNSFGFGGSNCSLLLARNDA